MTAAPLACRLIVEEPTGGAWNMAVDEVLLTSAAERGVRTLRFYGWAEPTLSLGYFQAYEDRLAHRPSRQCAVVRRSSGGGAILHDDELTYSLALPSESDLAKNSSWLYAAVHEALIELLYAQRMHSTRCGETGADEKTSPTFLCFQRRSAEDVLLDGAKICGSAQRRRKGGLLQHGSLLLGRSAAAPELPGLAELTGNRLVPRQLASSWAEAIGRKLNLQLEKGSLTAGELDAVRSLALEKFSTATWTRRR